MTAPETTAPLTVDVAHVRAIPGSPQRLDRDNVLPCVSARELQGEAGGLVAVRPPGASLGLLLGPSYTPPARLPVPTSPAEVDEQWWQWSTGRSQGPARRLWAACKLAALAAMLAVILTTGLIVIVIGVWWWVGQLL